MLQTLCVLFTLTAVDVPAALPEAAGPDPEAIPVATAPAERRPLRIAVVDFEVAGIPVHQGRVVEASLLAELRKLQGVSVIGMAEIRQMLDFEANKQLVGCSDESCLSEIAEALGVEVIVMGALSEVNDEHIFGLRRLNQLDAKVTGQVNRRFKKGNGEEFLVAIGPAVAELFPDLQLRPGVARGVAQEMAIRLNPPPLPAWVFWSGVGLSAAALATTGAFGVANALANGEAETYRTTADPFVNDVFKQKADAADQAAYASFAGAGALVAFATATTVAAFFTDFWGYAEMNEAALR